MGFKEHSNVVCMIFFQQCLKQTVTSSIHPSELIWRGSIKPLAEGGRGEIGKISHTIMHALLSPFTPHTDRIPHENKSIRVYMCSAASLCAQIEKKENRVRVAESSRSYFISTSTPTSALNCYRYLKKLKTKMYNKFKNKSF